MERSSIRSLTALLIAVLFASCSTIAQETANFLLEDNTSTIGAGKKKNTTGITEKQRTKQQAQLKKEGKCPTCRGMGKTPDGMYVCTVCNGTGKYTETTNKQ